MPTNGGSLTPSSGNWGVFSWAKQMYKSRALKTIVDKVALSFKRCNCRCYFPLFCNPFAAQVEIQNIVTIQPNQELISLLLTLTYSRTLRTSVK